jgi:hypothetical protein
MSDFAKFVTQKELVYVLHLIIRMAAIECKVAMCISRLVEFELLLELKFEEKFVTSLDSPCYKDTSSLKTVERLSIPVI